MDYNRIADDLTRNHNRAAKWIGTAIIILGAVLMLLVAAFVSKASAQARKAEAPTINELAALPESDFITVIGWCRQSGSRADTVTCRNAEHAFGLRYAETLRRKRRHMMDSPLYWLGNPVSLAHYGKLCDAGYREVARWCAPVRVAERALRG